VHEGFGKSLTPTKSPLANSIDGARRKKNVSFNPSEFNLPQQHAQETDYDYLIRALFECE
jgi:hypothetical protein